MGVRQLIGVSGHVSAAWDNADEQLRDGSGNLFLTSISGQDLSAANNSTSAFITAAAIPTDISTFTNDSGYLSTISGLYISALTNDAGYLTSIVGLNVSALTNDSGYLTVESEGLFNGWLNALTSSSGAVVSTGGGIYVQTSGPYNDNSSGENWATAAPTTTDDAINRIALALVGLLGTPIP